MVCDGTGAQKSQTAPVGENRATVASRIDSGVDTGAASLGEGNRRSFCGGLKVDIIKCLAVSCGRDILKIGYVCS